VKQPYKPIACGFHDELLSLATLKKVSEIRYIDNGDEKVVSDRIEDVFTKGEEEFLLTASGLIIRLDQLVSVNGKVLPKAL
jgi:transcriptional antiterminator Rof (Rho-off)